jgi:hypothetical protein
MEFFSSDQIIGRQNGDTEIYHDLMQERVREILLVATLYDSFILQQEGRISEKIYDEYFMLSLSNAPRITHAETGKQALEMLSEKTFDLVVIMLRINEVNPVPLAEDIRRMKPDIPVVLLLNDNTDIPVLFKWESQLDVFTDIFVWNGDSKVFLAMIKHIEDLMNVDNDTRVGLVHVILLVEDSIRYYSRYLPILYTRIIQQTQLLMSEENFDDRSMLLRMRSRPKILTSRNFENALEIIKKHKDFLLCIITDMAYNQNGKKNPRAGFELASHARKLLPNLPIVIQSSDKENELLASHAGAHFVDKNSPTLATDLTRFMETYLGFGPFLFRNSQGKFLAQAGTLVEMARVIEKVPEESLLYHGRKNHFSAWLMARGEIPMAKRIQPIEISDFKNPGDLRRFLTDVFHRVHTDKHRGTLVAYNKNIVDQEHLIIRLSGGALGGKGRGLAFVNALLHGGKLNDRIGNVTIRIPRTAIIGGETFLQFINTRPFSDVLAHRLNFSILRRAALNTPLPDELMKRLNELLESFTKPLAIRSSGILEDSISYPFSGVYPTYLIPNCHKDRKQRLRQLMDAVRLVYVSVYSPDAQSYFDSIGFPFEEERMALVVQEVVGNRYGEGFYPHFSGVAQSYNYYPFSKIKPEDGMANTAVGLGKHVCEGENSFRFSPKHPRITFDSIDQLIAGSQKTFWALNMRKTHFDDSYSEEATLTKESLNRAEKDGVLEFIASVWDTANKRLEPGLDIRGPRVIDFGQILKYDLFPLAKTVEHILETITQALGSAIEVEFAVEMSDYKHPIFHIVQIKHMAKQNLDFSIDADKLNNDELLLKTDRGLGNGQIDDIYDVIFADPNTFDRSKTQSMPAELEYFNRKLMAEKRKYILIGPGRWGTHDRWLGIPVQWSQISNAGAIVETDMKDIHVDASLGSHFFHNITSMKIGYFTVKNAYPFHYLDMDWLLTHPARERTEFFVHLHSETPLRIQMDGRKGVCVIYMPDAT